MSEQIRKNFDKGVRMDLACADKDNLSSVMSCVYFKDGFAYATDSVILVKNRISEFSTFAAAEIEALDGKYLPADFYKDILRYDECLISEEGIECHKDDDKAFFYFKDFGEHNYPDADKVLENALNKMTVPMPQIGFDIKNMERMRKALHGIDKCVAMFKGTNQPIVFHSVIEDVSSVGLLMPVRLDMEGDRDE